VSALDWIDWEDFDFDHDMDPEPRPTRRERALESLAKFSRLLARRKAEATKPQAPAKRNYVTEN
jgi:hypothetical protein